MMDNRKLVYLLTSVIAVAGVVFYYFLFDSGRLEETHESVINPPQEKIDLPESADESPRRQQPKSLPRPEPIVEENIDPALMTEEELRLWAGANPIDAARWVESLPSSETNREKRMLVALAWTTNDVSSAIEWVSEWPEDQWVPAMRSITYEASREEPEHALAIASSLPESDLRDELMGHAAAQYATKDGAAALEWAETIEDDALKERMYGRIAVAISEFDPVMAIELVYENVQSGRIRDNAIISVVQRWAQVNPSEAMEIVEQLPEGSLRETALENIERLRPEE